MQINDFNRVNFFKVCNAAIAAIVLLVLTGGCRPSPRLSPPENLSIKVAETNKPGVYALSGSAQFPEQSAITVMAIRYLQPATPRASRWRSQPYYVILDRRVVPLQQGQWQAQLNLWQVAADGRWQEAWQLSEKDADLSVPPDKQVAFLALLQPDNQAKVLREKLQKQGPPPSQNVAQVPSEGTWYIYAIERMELPLPTGKTKQPDMATRDINHGWGDQNATKPQPASDKTQKNAPAALPLPKTGLTTQPLSTREYMR